MFIAFINRHLDRIFIDGQPVAGNGEDLAVHRIFPGQTLELGAISVKLTEYESGGYDLGWHNQQETPPDGELELGEKIAFRSGECLGFFATQEEAKAMIDGFLAECQAVVNDLLKIIAPESEVAEPSDVS